MSIQDSNKFLKFVADNLTMIQQLFFSQVQHREQEDILQDCIIKVADTIKRRGIKKGSDFTAYLFFAYKNTIYTKNNSKRKSFINIDDAPAVLFTENEEAREEELIDRLKREDKIDEVFKYVEDNYKPLHSSLFKYYHKTKLSYREIAETTGYSLSNVFKINSMILKDVRKRFNGA